MNKLTKLLAATALALLLFGCGKDSPLTGTDGTGIEVTGYLTESLIQTTSTQPLSNDTPVELRIVGLPGAATNISEVKASNQRSGESQIGAVAGDGSFELALMVLKTDSISITPVGVDTEESVDIQVDTISEFPEIGDQGTDIEYAMEFLDGCDPFEGEDSEPNPDPGPEDDGEWEHDWSEEDFAPETEEDCETALVQVLLMEPLVSGQLLLFNSELNLVEAMESEDQQEWYGMIRALPGHVLWLVHEMDGDWSTVYSLTVPE